MPRRKFIYSREQGGVVEVTPEENRALCDEISADVAERSQPIEFGVGSSGKRRNANIWPVISDSMAINPEDIPREQEILRQHGVDVEYSIDQGAARPIWRDRAHKKKYQAALGWCDADAGYSDQAPTNFTQSDYRSLFRR